MKYIMKHRIRMADAYKEMTSCPEVLALGNEVLIMLKQIRRSIKCSGA